MDFSRAQIRAGRGGNGRHMGLQEVIQFIQAALECSVYVAPRERGLSREEVFEVSRRVGFQDGEIGDALASAGQYHDGRYLLRSHQMTMWHLFHLHEEPDYRNIEAFDFVIYQLSASVRAEGLDKARLERDLIVERAAAEGIPHHDVEVAITILVMSGQLTRKTGVLRFSPGREYQPLPSTLRRQMSGQPVRKEARALPIHSLETS